MPPLAPSSQAFLFQANPTKAATKAQEGGKRASSCPL